MHVASFQIYAISRPRFYDEMLEILDKILNLNRC